MSQPSNPLDQYESYLTHCVIAAYRDTVDAESDTLVLSKQEYDMGEETPNGAGIIVVNDHAPSPTQVLQFDIEYNWMSTHPSTTLTGGEVVLADRNATGFMKFLKEQVVAKLDGISIENLTFVLKVFWVTSAVNDDDKVIDSKEFYFSVPEIRHNTAKNKNFYMMTMLSLYNGKMQTPNYCNLYNLTVTHSEGGLHDKIPEPLGAGGGIRTRAEEDAEKLPLRKERIDASKPMKTLEDAFDALQIELQESTKIHKLQLQEWQSVIRSDFVDKLSSAEQEKDIPFEYSIELHEEYKSYEIDNRNLPFEQPEQRQEEVGIRSIPCKTGEPFYSLIMRIMGLSKKIGTDAADGYRPKIVAVWFKEADKIKIDIRIEKVKIPYNKIGNDTGDGGEGNVEPLMFFYRSNTGKDVQNVDVYGITGKTSRDDVALDIVETNPEGDGKVSFGGDRENITAERTKTVDFFETGFSGHRALIVNHKVMGVEYPHELAKYLSTGFVNQYIQGSEIVITIRGNPSLFSDLMRKPSHVAAGVEGDVTYYRKPEVYPIYVKCRVFYTKPEDENSNFESETVDGEFYHEDVYMHVHKIENQFTNGIFYQKLYMLRTDDLI